MDELEYNVKVTECSTSAVSEESVDNDVKMIDCSPSDVPDEPELACDDNANDSPAFTVGQRFDSYEAFQKALDEYAEQNNIQFWRRDARYLNRSVNKRVENAKKDLIYYTVKMCCIYGGRKFDKSKRSQGLRNTKSMRKDCPAFFTLVLSKGEQHLEISHMNLEHNHSTDPQSYNLLPHRRRLPEDVREHASALLEMKVDKKLLQADLMERTGKIVLLKDLENLKGKTKAKVTFKVCVIIPAAGVGGRMMLDVPKQYISVHQKPIICHTVEAFLSFPFVDRIIVVSSPDCLELMLDTLKHHCSSQTEKLVVSEGSTSRHMSIKAGVTAVESCYDVPPEVVIVHDGVRPFVPEEIVPKVVLAAKEHGAAGIVCPLVSTVVQVDEDGFLDTSLNRDQYQNSEMPQAFRYEVLYQAYEESSEYDLETGTECLQLVQNQTGVRAKLLCSTTHLWKVTHRKDIQAFAATAKENQGVGVVNAKFAQDFIPTLSGQVAKMFKGFHKLGRFDQTTLGRYPNIIQFHKDMNPYSILELMSGFTSLERLKWLTTVVHVFQFGFNFTVDFVDFQKCSRTAAKELRKLNLLFYFVIWNENSDTEEEKAELLTSLLFHCNPAISGNVFFS